MLWVGYMFLQECPLICPSFSWLLSEQIRSLWKISHQRKHHNESLMQVNKWYHDVCKHLGLLGQVLHILWRFQQTKLDRFDCFISSMINGLQIEIYSKNGLIYFTCCYYQVNHLVCSTLPRACLCTREPYRNCDCRWSIIWYICLPKMR